MILSMSETLSKDSSEYFTASQFYLSWHDENEPNEPILDANLPPHPDHVISHEHHMNEHRLTDLHSYEADDIHLHGLYHVIVNSKYETEL
jgi:hypothetical protein